MMAMSSTIASDLVSLRRRGLVQGTNDEHLSELMNPGITNVAYGLGAALGGPLGGLVTDLASWRWYACFAIALND